MSLTSILNSALTELLMALSKQLPTPSTCTDPGISTINALRTFYVLDTVLCLHFYLLSFQWSIISDYYSPLHVTNERNGVSKSLNTKARMTRIVFAKPADAPFFMLPDRDKVHAAV